MDIVNFKYDGTSTVLDSTHFFASKSAHKDPLIPRGSLEETSTWKLLAL